MTVDQIPDALFPSTDLGVPKLLPRFADFLDAPMRAWGAVSRPSRMRGTWHFYVDDRKFSALWSDPSKLHASSRVINAVEINWTIQDQTPYPVALYRIYQKRWISRYLQEKGLKILVDLNVPSNYADLNEEGVPYDCSAFATRATDSRVDVLERHYSRALKYCEKPLFVAYGGGKKVAAFCQENDCIHVRDSDHG